MRIWCSGNIRDSKPPDLGSIPSIRANPFHTGFKNSMKNIISLLNVSEFYYHGVRSLTGRASECDSERCRFDFDRTHPLILP